MGTWEVTLALVLGLVLALVLALESMLEALEVLAVPAAYTKGEGIRQGGSLGLDGERRRQALVGTA